MYRYIPNLITLSRLILTLLFFVTINITVSAVEFARLMWLAMGMFLLAVFSDALDGYLARHWKVETAFGRVVDPFADKILICGAFVFFSFQGFVPMDLALPSYIHGPEITGIVPWMAVLLIAREFLITGIRGFAESRGIDFRAQWAGKLKMFIQCAAIVGVMLCLALVEPLSSSPILYWLVCMRDLAIWATLVITVLSAIQYIVRARRLIHEK
jgi:CDP-diacylglycerol---glycerol-3-phosphate 3-phosphatidyltransferase